MGEGVTMGADGRGVEVGEAGGGGSKCWKWVGGRRRR